MEKDLKEMSIGEFLSITGGLFGGFMLALVTQKMELIPGLLILLPGFLEMRGSVSGTLSGRLSSGLFVKAFKPIWHNNRILRGNIIAAFFLGITIALALGVLAYIMGFFVFGIMDPRIIFLAIIAGALSTAIQIPITTGTTFYLFKKGHDPNNIMGPYLTTTGDIVSIFSLLVALVIV